MDILAVLREQLGKQTYLEELEPGVSRLYIPLFHEDGDMLSIYIDSQSNNQILIRDYGNTLMRVSYTFDINTEHKKKVLYDIIKSNNGSLDDGEIIYATDISARLLQKYRILEF